jgi:hypothetical protein
MNYINKEKINYYKNIINNTSEIDVKTKIDKIDNSKKKTNSFNFETDNIIEIEKIREIEKIQEYERIREIQRIQEIENINLNKNNIIKLLPLRQLLENRDRSILYDPLIAPERRISIDQYPVKIQDVINIPSRGQPDNYQLLGIMHRNSDEKIVQLFGRATFIGSNQYEYYVTTDQHGFSNKIPIETKGRREIVDNDVININEFDKSKGEFKVKIYNYNAPRYNPYM